MKKILPKRSSADRRDFILLANVTEQTNFDALLFDTILFVWFWLYFVTLNLKDGKIGQRSANWKLSWRLQSAPRVATAQFLVALKKANLQPSCQQLAIAQSVEWWSVDRKARRSNLASATVFFSFLEEKFRVFVIVTRCGRAFLATNFSILSLMIKEENKAQIGVSFFELV